MMGFMIYWKFRVVGGKFDPVLADDGSLEALQDSAPVGIRDCGILGVRQPRRRDGIPRRLRQDSC